MIETVAKHCKHPDCRYRHNLTNKGVPYCAYIIYERQPRKDKISECTKYISGKIRVSPYDQVEITDDTKST